MKTKFYLTLIVCSLFLFPKKSEAQINAYFQNNPVWQIHNSCSFGGPCFRIEDYNYLIKGDTLIDSIQYVKVYKNGQGFFDWQAPFMNPGCVGTFIYRDSVARYFMRSDNRQVMIRLPGDSAEQVLYDFNLSVGDTLPLSYNNHYRDIVVSAIDSVDTPNGIMQRFLLTGLTWSQYLIEGIGHSRGLVEPLKSDIDCVYELKCFGGNDSAYYPVKGASCTIAIGINNYPSKIALSLYPNPFSNSTTFEFDNSFKNLELKIFNIFGQEQSYFYAEPNGKIVLEKGNLSSGIYFYELIHDKKVKASGKVILEEAGE